MNNSKRISVKEIVQGLEDENRIECDISHRGGNYGAHAFVVVGALFPTLSDEKQNELINLMPRNFGVYCNYLGGGIRGAIIRSDYNKTMPAKYAKRLDSFTRECKARYLAIENGSGLNDEEYPDGEVNWDALASRRSREAGIESAY